MMDNRIFNVNGRGEEMLGRALSLAFEQSGMKLVEAWIADSEKGLILLWSDNDETAIKFPVPLTVDQVIPTVAAYLNSEEASSVKLDGWDEDADHDGSNGVGWRVYCEEWGHVKSHYAICAIKRVHLWYGK